MSQILRTGLQIGGLCVAWTFVMGFTGWYKDPALAGPLFLAPVILIEVALLGLGLKATAAGQGYRRQVLTGTLMSVVAAVVIFCGSMVFASVAFPSYFEDLRAAHRQMLQAAGRSQAEIDAALAAAAAANPQTPVSNALAGVIGTIATGLPWSE
jgi:hypothetical protein